MNCSDVNFKFVGSSCSYLMCLFAKRCDSLFYSIDRGRKDIKNLLAHCQYLESSKIIHEAYNGDFRVRLMIIFVIGLRAVLVDTKLQLEINGGIPRNV